jgi:ribonuclease HI
MINLFCDGACEPKNPGGVATYGWIAYERQEDESNGKVLASGKDVVADGGKNATNNYAEYCGLGFALRWLQGQKYTDSIFVYLDSKLVVHQVLKEWKCNPEHLQKLRQRIWDLAKEMHLYTCNPKQKQTIEECGIQEKDQRYLVLQWIPREQNEAADALSKEAFVEHQERHGRSTRVPERRKKKAKAEVRCHGCGWKGSHTELLDDEDKDALVCPRCETSGIVAC